jgi:tetratricopeptide (TPR) repeat protein
VPYDAPDTLAVAYAHVNDPLPVLPQPLSQLQPVLDRMLAKQPEQRYANAGELRQALKRIARGESLERPGFATASQQQDARPASTPDGQGKRQGAGWAIGGALAALMVVAGVYGFMQDDLPRPGGGGAAPVAPATTVFEEQRAQPQQPVVVTNDTAQGVKEILAGGSVTAPKPAATAEAAASPLPENDAAEAARAREIAAREAEQRQARLAALAQQQEIERLLKSAAADLAATRLSSPVGNNAVEKYEQILKLAPGNAEAEAGLAQVVGRYLKLANGASRVHEYAKANRYLAKAEMLQPTNREVISKRKRLAEELRLYNMNQEQLIKKPGFTDESAEYERPMPRVSKKLVKEGYYKELRSGGEWVNVNGMEVWKHNVEKVWVQPVYE